MVALPRERRESNEINDIAKGLGENGPIVIQGVSESPPKPSSAIAQVPDLIVDPGNLPATAREVRDLFANVGLFFDRGAPVKVVPTGDIGPPIATALTTHRVVIEVHTYSRPVEVHVDQLVPVTLPDRVARRYLHLAGEWNLPPLAGYLHRAAALRRRFCANGRGL